MGPFSCENGKGCKSWDVGCAYSGFNGAVLLRERKACISLILPTFQRPASMGPFSCENGK